MSRRRTSSHSARIIALFLPVGPLFQRLQPHQHVQHLRPLNGPVDDGDGGLHVLPGGPRQRRHRRRGRPLQPAETVLKKTPPGLAVRALFGHRASLAALRRRGLGKFRVDLRLSWDNETGLISDRR